MIHSYRSKIESPPLVHRVLVCPGVVGEILSNFLVWKLPPLSQFGLILFTLGRVSSFSVVVEYRVHSSSILVDPSNSVLPWSVAASTPSAINLFVPGIQSGISNWKWILKFGEFGTILWFRSDC